MCAEALSQDEIDALLRGQSDAAAENELALAPEESDLESLSGNVFTERLAGGRKMYFHGAAGEGDRRDDAWTWFAVACVLCMLGEVAALLAFRT